MTAAAPPRTIALMMVRDENDIIAANLRHHSAVGVDGFVIIDHGSEDGTSKTLEALGRDGLALVCRRRDRGEAPQVEAWYEELVAEARGLAADRIVPIDADEFWLPSSGSFATLDWPEEKPVITAHRSNMLAPASALADGAAGGRASVIDSHVYRIANPYSPVDYYERVVMGMNGGTAPPAYPILMTRLVPKVAFWLSALGRIGMAGHCVIAENGEFLQPPGEGDATIFHYPVRGYAQFERKVRAFAQAFALLPDLEKAISWEARYLCGLLEDGRLGQEFRRYFPDRDELGRLLAGGVIVHDPRLSRRAGQTAEELDTAASLNRMIAVQQQAIYALAQGRDLNERRIADIKTDLAKAQAELSPTTQENAALRERIAAMEAENSRLRRGKNPDVCAPDRGRP